MENRSTPPDVSMNPPSIPNHVPPYQRAPMPKNVLLFMQQQKKTNMTKKPVTDYQNLSLKPQRVRWDAELHALFVQVVNMLGGHKKATAKKIQFYMKVEGLTLSQITSHLQIFRQGGPKKLKNVQGMIPQEVVQTSITPIFESSSSTPRIVALEALVNNDQQIMTNQMSNNEIGQFLMQEQIEAETPSIPYTMMESYGDVALPSGDPLFAGEGEQEENLAATYFNLDGDNVVSLSNFNGD